MLEDLRSAFRQILKHRNLAGLAILTLALAIGANTAIFSVVNAVLIEPLPYPEADRLVSVFEGNSNVSLNAVSGGAWKDWREHGTHFTHLALYERFVRNLTGFGEPVTVPGMRVTNDFLPALGIDPILGRGFAADADVVGGENRVVLLSYSLWQSHFGGREEVLGEQIALHQVDHTVIGVLPPMYLLDDDALFLVPSVIDKEPDQWTRSGHWRSAIARLTPGSTATDLETELRAIKTRLNDQYPPFKEDWTVNIVPTHEVYAGDARPTLLILLATVGLVLLIACANVSNLLLARGQARTREMAVRVALGADGWRIVRQLLTESLVLGLAGCALGLLVAQYGIELLGTLMAQQLPFVFKPELDQRVLVFSIAAACGSALLFGILPALRARRAGLGDDLRSRGVTRRSRAQSMLVVAQIAFTLVLLVGAGLLLRSFALVVDTDPGFEPENTLAFDLAFPNRTYPEVADRLAFIDAVTERLAALPGVEHVGTASDLPMNGGGSTEFASRGDSPPTFDYVASCVLNNDGFLDAMGIELLRGRGISRADSQSGAELVAVVDSTLAADLYPDEDPIGQMVRIARSPARIVGVVEPIRQYVLDADPRPTIYMSQAVPWAPSTSVVLRTSVPPETLSAVVRDTVLAVDPDQPVANIRTLEQALHRSLATRRVTLALLALFAGVAVTLACIGIYGLMAYGVSQRARELSIRAALGAKRTDLFRLVLGGGAGLIGAGLIVGLIGALTLGRFLDSLLYQIQAHDPVVLVAALVVLGLVALGATALPTRRAVTADPAVALREE
ncbi:MAG: ABC transporter permease [Acidobacteriota bacterium]